MSEVSKAWIEWVQNGAACPWCSPSDSSDASEPSATAEVAS